MRVEFLKPYPGHRQGAITDRLPDGLAMTLTRRKVVRVVPAMASPVVVSPPAPKVKRGK